MTPEPFRVPKALCPLTVSSSTRFGRSRVLGSIHTRPRPWHEITFYPVSGGFNGRIFISPFTRRRFGRARGHITYAAEFACARTVTAR